MMADKQDNKRVISPKTLSSVSPSSATDASDSVTVSRNEGKQEEKGESVQPSSPSTKNIFQLVPTISIEESPSPPPVVEMSELEPSPFTLTKGEKRKEDDEEETNAKGQGTQRVKKDMAVSLERGCSLESIPSLDEDSESVSLGIKDDDGDGDSLSSLSSLHNAPNSKSGKVRMVSSLRMRRPKTDTRGFRNAKSVEGRFDEVQAEELAQRLKALAAAFSARTIKTKAKIRQPPTPSSDESEGEDSKVGEPTLLDRLRQLASPGPSEFGDSSRRKSIISTKVEGTFLENLDYFYNFITCNFILDPQSSMYLSWLTLVGIVFLYNAWVIPLRVIFPYQTERNELAWFIVDSIADFIYLMDVLIFKPHVKFLQSGFWVKEPKQMMRSYLGSIQFKIDLIALFPADIIVHFFYTNTPILRITRILKIETFWELFRQLDTVLAHPHRARIFHTCLYMLYMIHMVACMYYGLSLWEGIGETTWTFDGIGNAYVRCFYFATKTATSIGKNPKPENELEYVFMTFAWLSGVFVFAILIGQIRDIIATATKSQTEYRILTSATASYLHRLGVPKRLQDRVKLWLSYTWENQKTLDETRILNLLPKSMKAEIALNIHVETLGKVKLFQSCEALPIWDLVVKLRSIIILPGDFVCRKGEIGREMFIVKSGKIQVIGGESGTQVLASLGEGSVFGEIALLGIGGMNKRTADVRAAGFVNLFVLNKSDLNDVIRDYPEAQEIMQRKAKKLMRESIKKVRASPSPIGTPEDCISLAEESTVIIKNKEEPPQLIHTMLKLFPATTKIGRYLRKGSKQSPFVDQITNGGGLLSSSKPPEDEYTIMTSYPPSPFIPMSPVNISQELNISIMTGDSSDRLLSPPNGHTSSDGFIPDDQADPFGTDNYPERSKSTLPPFAGTDNDIAIIKVTSDPATLPVPPETVDEGLAKYGNREPRKSCPHFESFVGTNREEIPIELRPPLYIIEPRCGGGGNERSGSSKSRILRRIVLQQDSTSLESEGAAIIYDKRERNEDNDSVGTGTGGVDNIRESSSSPSASTSIANTALIVSRFISRTRGPLERQSGVDMEVLTEKRQKKVPPREIPHHPGVVDDEASYSLDIDSD